MNGSDKRIALITGTSAGIGHATALALATSGYTTYATARHTESIENLKAQGLQTLALDVTNEQSMTEAINTIELQTGGIDILVNNAGYSEMGPIEEVSMERIRLQFETNVFGLIRLCQLVLPGMRRKHNGRIINVSSMGAEFTTPLAGIYHASKYAVEAISDALRFEVQPFGVHVVVIQPGVVRTRSASTVTQNLQSDKSSPYFDQVDGFKRFLEKNTAENDASAIPAEAVAKVIVEAIEAPEPKTRYKVGDEAEQLSRLRRNLSDREWDALFSDQFGLKKKA
ncbi:MAG: oxidoreductase [Anaerolineales bacterium]